MSQGTYNTVLIFFLLEKLLEERQEDAAHLSFKCNRVGSMTDEETTELRSEIKVRFIVCFYFRLLKDMVTYYFGLIIIFEVNVQPLLNFVNMLSF